MDGIEYAVFTKKSFRLRENNQYTSNVESGSTRTEIKHWVELFFGVKVIAMNSHRLPKKRKRGQSPNKKSQQNKKRMGLIMGMGHKKHYRRMIITLQPGYSILPYKPKPAYSYSILPYNRRYIDIEKRT